MHCFERGLEVEVVLIISRASPRRSQRGARQLEGMRGRGRGDEDGHGPSGPSRAHGCVPAGGLSGCMSGGKQDKRLSAACPSGISDGVTLAFIAGCQSSLFAGCLDTRAPLNNASVQ